MDNGNRRPCVSTCCLGLILGVIFGALVGVLFAFRYIPGIVTGLWIAFGIAVLALILLFAGAYLTEVNTTVSLSKCLYKHMRCLLTGIFGTILSTIVLLSSALTPSLIIFPILVSVAAMFFMLLIVELITFICCFIYRSPRCQD